VSHLSIISLGQRAVPKNAGKIANQLSEILSSLLTFCKKKTLAIATVKTNVIVETMLDRMDLL
jgi:hypothetical protein